jgi:hypothetical protein
MSNSWSAGQGSRCNLLTQEPLGGDTLIKNCIICWNYLYLSQKLEEIEDAASRQVFLDAVTHCSVISWRHINLLGEYDFSDKKLWDSVGIRSAKLTP